jgi:hypothetical protein
VSDAASDGEGVTDALVAAVHDHTLADVARSVVAGVGPDEVSGLAASDQDVALAALAACARIDDELARSVVEIEAALAHLGDRARVVVPEPDAQYHLLRVHVDDHSDALAVGESLRAIGFTVWETWSGGAAESFRRFGTQLTYARTDDVSLVVSVRWGHRARRTGWRSVAARAVVPTAGDWEAIDLPRWAWWAYSFVRPVRQAAERLGWRRRYPENLGPFLATPDALLDPLFAFADLGPGDVVVDIGCGDGRIVVAAAERVGCRARGVERSADLAAAARARASAAGVAHLVDIEVGDGRDVDLSDATVVFVFLPVEVVREILADLLDRLASNVNTPAKGVTKCTARLVVHEQNPLALTSAHPPAERRVLAAGNAVTVAHRWDVRG